MPNRCLAQALLCDTSFLTCKCCQKRYMPELFVRVDHLITVYNDVR